MANIKSKVVSLATFVLIDEYISSEYEEKTTLSLCVCVCVLMNNQKANHHNNNLAFLSLTHDAS